MYMDPEGMATNSSESCRTGVYGVVRWFPCIKFELASSRQGTMAIAPMYDTYEAMPGGQVI